VGRSKIDFNFRRIYNADLLIIAGEHSGDQHAAEMVRGLKKAKPDLRIAAFGGKALSDSGADLLFDMTSFSVVGLYEVVKNFLFFSKLLKSIFFWIKECSPKAVCFVDYPGFNLRLAQALFDNKIANKAGGNTKLLYYISPQIWAWKPRRKYKIAKIIDELATIFPFEEQYFDDTDLKITFVGHPFVNDGYISNITYGKHDPILLCPGSRKGAIKKIFPALLKSMCYILKNMPNTMAVIPYPDNKILCLLRKILFKDFREISKNVTFVHSSSKISASAAVMSSGTMSLKCCLVGIPGAIVYKTHPLTYLIGKALVNVKYLGIANILLQKNIWKEFLQTRCRPVLIAKFIIQCLENEKLITMFQNASDDLKKILSQTAKMTACDWALSVIQAN
jgi:lipid-A-disaccharide synthase